MQFFLDNSQTIFTLLGALIVYIYHIVAQRVPAQQRAYIEKWATAAVAMVEQQYSGKSNSDKKLIAMHSIKDFFRAFKLPVPPDDVLSSFIEAAVNALPPSESPPNPPQVRRASGL
jgi:hypothetical protein